MLDQLKSILLTIRKNREEDLKRCCAIWKGQNEYVKQQQLLALELPFPTDQKTITESRGLFFQEQKEKRRRRLSKTAYQLINEWKNIGEASDIDGKNAFCDFLQQIGGLRYYLHGSDKPIPISGEQLTNDLFLDKMLRCIELGNLNDSLKNLYRSYAENLHFFIHGSEQTHPLIFKTKQPLELSDAEKFFLYLEDRALKSATIRAYSDILLCRALFYIPLPAKKLFALEAPYNKEEKWVIDFQDQSFRIPKSFVELWRTFSLSNRLLPKEFNEDQLSKKIHRLGEYAGLSQTLNPSVLRVSQNAICNNILLIHNSWINALPGR